MKSIAGMTVLSVLSVLLMGASVTSAQAADASGMWFAQGPQLLLAEGGSERLMPQQQRLQAHASQRPVADEGQRFVQLIEENPTAAGHPIVEKRLDRQSKSPLHMERGLNGSPH